MNIYINQYNITDDVLDFPSLTDSNGIDNGIVTLPCDIKVYNHNGKYSQFNNKSVFSKYPLKQFEISINDDNVCLYKAKVHQIIEESSNTVVIRTKNVIEVLDKQVDESIHNTTIEDILNWLGKKGLSINQNSVYRLKGHYQYCLFSVVRTSDYTYRQLITDLVDRLGLIMFHSLDGIKLMPLSTTQELPSYCEISEDDIYSFSQDISEEVFNNYSVIPFLYNDNEAITDDSESGNNIGHESRKLFGEKKRDDVNASKSSVIFMDEYTAVRCMETHLKRYLYQFPIIGIELPTKYYTINVGEYVKYNSNTWQVMSKELTLNKAKLTLWRM